MENFVYTQALKEIGTTYVGGVSTSHKLELSYKNGVSTYGVYLAPANMAVANKSVCPKSEHCKEFCLQGSGHNKMAILSGKNTINKARIKKTLAFWYKRVLFAETIAHEIRREYKKAQKEGRPFSVRLNCTSDINPELLILSNGNNLFQEFPHIQFYDYTKVKSHLKLVKKYSNYDLTFSYDGHNWGVAKEYLKQGGRVAVVFRDEKKLPKKFRGFKVIDGNKYDMRYLDPKSCIIGLTFHKTANNYKVIDGKRTFVEPNSDFVIPNNDLGCEW